MDGHARIATIATGYPAALRAKQGRGKTPPVQKQQNLTALLQMRVHRHEARCRQPVVTAMRAQVDDAHARLGNVAGTFGQLAKLVTTGLRIVKRLQRRGRRSQHHRDPVQPGPDDGQIARRVAKAVLLFEGTVVFFIDDDQAWPRHRREYRRAGPEYDGCLAAARHAPRFQPLAVGQARVEYRKLSGQAFAKAPNELRGQADLGNQHHGLLPAGQQASDQRQIDLGLAAAGDAVEQVGAVAAKAFF